MAEKPSILDQLKKLDEQRNALLSGAKDEYLKQANDAIAGLNELGFSYRLVEGNAPATKKAGTKRTADPNRPCTICKFVTDPPHDGRQHRNQDPKKPFTAKELGELSFKRREA